MHKPCAEPGCVTLAVFNQPGAGHGLYCGQHKRAGYVNVKVSSLYLSVQGIPAMLQPTLSGRGALARQPVPDRKVLGTRGWHDVRSMYRHDFCSHLAFSLCEGMLSFLISPCAGMRYRQTHKLHGY